MKELPELISPPITTENVNEITDMITNSYIGWTKATYEINPYSYQIAPARRIFKSLLLNDGAEIYMTTPRQVGKTTFISSLTNFISVTFPTLYEIPQFKAGVNTGIFAPIYGQSTLPFIRIKNGFAEGTAYELFDIRWTENNGNTFRLSNSSRVRCMTASETASIMGETYNFLIIDETESVSDFKLEKEILPMGASTNATVVYTGTPNMGFINEHGKECRRFYNGINGMAPKENVFWYHDKDITEAKRKMFEEDKNTFHLKWEEHYNKMKAQLGEFDDTFKTQYKCEWIVERGLFVSFDILMSCGGDYNLIKEQKTGFIAVGIDVAKSPDSTVVCVVEILPDSTIKILNILELLNENYDDQMEVVKEFLSHYNVAMIYCDATGVGNMFVDYLKKNVVCNFIIGLNLTAKVQSEVFSRLSSLFQNKRIKFPYGNNSRNEIIIRKFIHQFQNLEKGYRGNFLWVSHPDKKGEHDDYAYAVGLACYSLKDYMPGTSTGNVGDMLSVVGFNY